MNGELEITIRDFKPANRERQRPEPLEFDLQLATLCPQRLMIARRGNLKVELQRAGDSVRGGLWDGI